MPKEDTQFKKGQSGNINGRPKGAVSIKTILKRFLSEEINTTNPITKQTESLSVADIIVLKQIGAAMGGDLAAAKWIEGIVKDEFADRNDSIPEAQVVSSDSDEDTEQEIRLTIIPKYQKCIDAITAISDKQQQ